MFSLFGKSGGGPDHPMSSMAEARSLLSELPKDDAFKALGEVTSWLVSVTDTSGFQTDLRIKLTMLLDETGQPYHANLLHSYLEAPHLQDFEGTHLWQNIYGFSKALVSAYATCLASCKQDETIPTELKAQLPLLSVRLLRSCAEQMKLELMRYVDVKPDLWQQMLGCYEYAEAEEFADHMVYAYPGHAIHTSVQRELVRALMLHESSPDTLAPDQIEVSFRIAGRMTSHFDFRTEPDESCEYYIDLAHPGAPGVLDNFVHTTASMRYFSAQRALPKIDEIIRQHERGSLDEERRFGSEFTPGGKLTVLKHLRVYWNMARPRHHSARRGISALIEVAHNFRSVSRLVPHAESNQSTAADGDAGQNRMGIAEETEAPVVSESWSVIDLSVHGIGAMIPRTGGSWVKIGDLCGIKAEHAPAWWVGMVRRLHADQQGILHAGIEILAKKPLSLWLRVLGKGAERVSNWETSSGSFQYDYVPAILLPDEHNSYLHATMLLESGCFASDNMYEAMLGEKSREIRLVELLAEGEDYEMVSFQWLNAARN